MIVRAIFDEKVFIPDQPVDLPAGQKVILRVERVPIGTPGKDLLKFAGTLDSADAAEMLKIIEEECGRIDPEEWK